MKVAIVVVACLALQLIHSSAFCPVSHGGRHFSRRFDGGGQSSTLKARCRKGTASTATTTSTLQASLHQCAPQAVSLFQNMITPASILAGAIVPMAFASPLGIKSDNETENRPTWVLMRKAYNVSALLSLLSNLIAVMWSVISVNQLLETRVAPAESVWHLLRRDFDLPW